MTNEQIQALRDKFETAVMERICISKSTLISLRSDEGYRNSTLSGHDYQGDWEFFLAGYSCLLAERDADKELIAEQAKRITELEARTLAVKLPDSVIDAICLTAAEIHNLGRGVSDNRAQEIINSIRCAAGITLIVGE